MYLTGLITDSDVAIAEALTDGASIYVLSLFGLSRRGDVQHAVHCADPLRSRCATTQPPSEGLHNAKLMDGCVKSTDCAKNRRAHRKNEATNAKQRSVDRCFALMTLSQPKKIG
jgi:hypothetical protein